MRKVLKANSGDGIGRFATPGSWLFTFERLAFGDAPCMEAASWPATALSKVFAYAVWADRAESPWYSGSEASRVVFTDGVCGNEQELSVGCDAGELHLDK